VALSRLKRLIAVILIAEISSWGVWLGRHISDRISEVSQDELREDGNLS